MGSFITKTHDGHLIRFTIKGDEPSSTEMGRIGTILSERQTGAQAATAPPNDGGPGVVKSLAGGVGSGVNQLQSSYDRVMQSYYEATGNKVTADEYAQAAKRNKEEGEAYARPESGSGYIPSPSSIAGSIGESAPGTALGLAGAYAGGEIGAAIGAFGGPLDPLTVPAGAAIGAAIGAGVTFLPSMLESNAERQIEQHGYVKDWGKAYGAAVPQAAVEGITEVILGKVGGFLLKPFVKVGAKPASDIVRRAVDNGVKGSLTYAAKRLGKDAALTAVSGATEEVIQQGLERWQAELPLMDDKAKEEYIQSAIMGGIVESIFGTAASGFGTHHELKAGRAQRNAEDAQRQAHEDAQSDLDAARRERERGDTSQYKAPLVPAPPEGENLGAAIADPDLVAPPSAPSPVLPPGLDPEAAPEAQQKPARSFQTEHGSTYDVFDDGTTVRNKSDHTHVGHDATDAGIKARSSRTVYVEGAANAQGLSAAGLMAHDGQPARARVVIKNGKSALLTWNPLNKSWGYMSPKEGITVHDEPAVGRYPLELWNKHDDVKSYPEAYSGMHAGSQITSMSEPVTPTAPVAEKVAKGAVTPTPQIGEQSALFTDAEYHNAVKTLSGKGKLSPQKIAKHLGVNKITSEAYFNELLKRGDAHPTGRKGQYAQVTMPASEASKVADETKTRTLGRSFEVTPVVPPNHAPFEVHLDGTKQGDAFKTQAEAQDWIDQNVEAGRKKDAGIVEQTSGLKHAVDEVLTEHLPGRDPHELRRKRRVFNSEIEARQAVGAFDPAYSSESNKWREEQAPEDRQAEVVGDIASEVGDIRKIMQTISDRIVGAGRTHVNVVPKIDADYARSLGVPDENIPDNMKGDTLIEGITHPDYVRGTLERVVALASELGNPNLSVDEKIRRMAAVLNHELIHVLRNLNLLTNEEWRTLVKLALTAKVPGKKYTWVQRSAARQTNLLRANTIEEGVAEMFRHYINDPSSFTPAPRALLAKLADFVKRLIGLGRKHDAKAVMDAIFGGEVSQRPINYGGLPVRNADDMFFSLLKPDNFYLKSLRFLKGVKQEKAPPEQWKSMLKNAGIRKDEANWLGIEDWLDEWARGHAAIAGGGQLVVDKRDIMNFIKASGPDVQVQVRSDAPSLQSVSIGAPRWREKTQSGGTELTEVAFLVPPPAGEPDFPGNVHVVEPSPTGYGSESTKNVLAFARLKTIWDGAKKVLFIEEIQSDLHQQAAKAGGYYSKTLDNEIAKANVDLTTMQRQRNEDEQLRKDTTRQVIEISDQLNHSRVPDDRRAALTENREALRKQRDAANDRVNKASADLNELFRHYQQLQLRRNIPNAPFKTGWEDYVIKRLVRHAAEHGFDAVAWHGEPDSVAATEGYNQYISETDPSGSEKYFSDPRKQVNLTSIFNRYLEKMPRIVRKLAQPFGADLEVTDANTVDFEYGAPQDMGGYGYVPPFLDTPKAINEHFVSRKSVSRIYNRIKAKLEASPPDQNEIGDAKQLVDWFGKVVQVIANQRTFDPAAAFSRAGMLAADIRDGMIWANGTWDDVQQRSATSVKGAFPYKHYRLDLNAQMQEGFERGDIARFSALERNSQRVMNDPNFRQWFFGSVVANPDGSPKVVYHYSNADQDFGSFSRLSHFGTARAAEERQHQVMRRARHLSPEDQANYMANSRTYPVFLSLQNPLHIRDDGSSHDAFAYGLAMRDAGILPEKEFSRIMALRLDKVNNLNSYTKEGEQAALDQIITRLEAAGHDGFSYLNRGEDKGSMSYVAVHPEQIKGIFNGGTWGQGNPDFMYSATEERKTQIMADPKFQQWFHGSSVTDPNDKPLVVYHGTKADQNFGRFHRLTHFGTLQAAEQRLDPADFPLYVNGDYLMSRLKIPVNERNGYWAKLPQEERDRLFSEHWQRRNDAMEGSRIYPVFLNIRRPMEIYDSGAQHDVRAYLDDAVANGVLTDNESDAVRMLNNYSTTQALGKLVSLLEKKGYDGFSYRNNVEDSGSTSYVTFRPEQIKSIFNTGEWGNTNPDFMYSAMEERGRDLWANDDNFKHWFGGSRVVDENGNPFLMFHGTTGDFDTFDETFQGKATGHPTAGLGFFFTADPMTANDFAGFELSAKTWPPTVQYAKGANVIPAFLSIKNPRKMDMREFTQLVHNTSWSDPGSLVPDLKAQLLKDGYDGIQLVGAPGMSGTEYEHDTWIAFHPGQIKSALSKEFSTENDSFKYSAIEPKYAMNAPIGQRVPAAAPRDRLEQMAARMTHDNVAPILNRFARTMGLGTKTENVIQSSVIQLQDRMQPFAKLVDEVRKNGGTVNNDSDVFVRAELFPGRVDGRLITADRDLYQPLAKTVHDLPVTQRDADELARLTDISGRIVNNYDHFKQGMAETYIYAQHALERNAEMARRNAVARLGEPQQTEGSGMTDNEATAILAWFNSKPFGQAFASETNRNSLRMRYRTLIAALNDNQVEGGLNPDFRIMTKADGTPADPYTDYAPIRGYLKEHLSYDSIAEVFARAGRGFNIRGKESRSATGRGYDPIPGGGVLRSIGADTIANAILMHQESIVRSEKNKVDLAFEKLLDDNPRELAMLAEHVPAGQTKYAYNPATGLVQQRVDQSIPNDPNILKYKKDGQQKYIRFRDERLAKAMGGKEGLGGSGGETLLYSIAKLTRFIANTVTSWNPEFALSNVVKDIETALINVSEHDAAGMKTKILKGIGPAGKGVWNALRNGDTTSEGAKNFLEFQKYGGRTSSLQGLLTLDDAIEKVNKTLSVDDGRSWYRQSWDKVKAVGDFIEHWNLAIENATRVSAYIALRDHFLSLTDNPNDPVNIERAREYAAFHAKRLTINFNTGGESKNWLGALWMFFNAGIQGTVALVNPMLRSKRMRRIWGSVIVAGVLEDVLNSLISPDDDDGKKIYDKIDDYILEHNLVLIDPFGITSRGYIKLPLPYGFNGLHNLGRAVSRGLRGGYTVGEAVNSSVATLWNAFNPLGEANSILNYVAPTILDPVVDLYLNENYAGVPIAPAANPYGQDQVNSQRYWTNTSPALVTVADWASRLTGREGEYLPGYLEVSPNQLGYIMAQATGGIGQFVGRAYSMLAPEAAGGKGVIEKVATGDFKDLDFNDIIFARRFIGNVTTKNDLQQYIKGRDELLRVRTALRAASQAGDSELYTSIMRNHQTEYRASIRINAIENARKKMSALINKVRRSDRLTDARKQELITKMKDKQDKLVGIGNTFMETVQ